MTESARWVRSADAEAWPAGGDAVARLRSSLDAAGAGDDPIGRLQSSIAAAGHARFGFNQLFQLISQVRLG